MNAARFDRPGPDEFAPFYAAYVAKVPDGNLLASMADQVGAITATLGSLSEAKGAHAYAPGKWTIKEVVGHMVDAERVFSYRAMNFARQDPASLPSFDENAWIGPGRFNERTLASLVGEMVTTRNATLALLSGLPDDAPTRRGTASNRIVSVRALAHIMYGHVAHHLGIITERYL